MSELKPCPFCGGKAFLYVSSGVRVMCEKCAAQTVILCDSVSSNGKPCGNATRSVIEKWNTRAGDNNNE